MRAWNELSMAEKADIMKLAIDGGVYDLDAIRSGYNEYAKGGKIHIAPSKRGTFTAAASKHGMGVQQFASRVLAHPENYSPAMRKKANFARNASKWKHALGGPLQEGDDYPEGYWENRREHPEVRPQYKRTKKDDEYWEEKNRRNAQAAEELNRREGVVMSALSDTANSVPFTGSEVAEAAEAQRQEKLDKAHELKMGLDATMTAAELLAAGYGVTRGLTHLNRYIARQATQSTGQAISRDAMRNLAKWNRRVTRIDKPQVLMNGIGGTADAYQWYTADNNFDAWENGLETGANAAGVVGGMNWFRNLPYLRRIGGDKIDAVLDGLGYGAAGWDVVKNLPPVSTALEGIREQGKVKEKAYGGELGNYYDGWGDAWNFLKSGVQKARQKVKDWGLDKSPAQHLKEVLTPTADKKYKQNLYNMIDPTSDIPSGVDIAKYGIIALAAKYGRDYPYQRTKVDSVADAAWAKRLGLDYNQSALIDNGDGTVRLPSEIEAEIPTDTTALKQRIANNEKRLKQLHGGERRLTGAAIDFDKEALEALRKTYSTGEPVMLDEHSHVSRNWHGLTPESAITTPLNTLHRYTVQYDKDNNRMKYWDWYDFNGFEDFVPGSPYKIQGFIDLNKKK